jgi:thymidylate synthase (FAD)
VESKFTGGDKMKVVVLTYTENAEYNCAKAMRSTRTRTPAEELVLSRDEVVRLLRLARKEKHFGVFEHATFTVSVSEVSRALTHQLVRHRIASYLQQSQRAVKIDTKKEWYVTPPSIQNTIHKRYFTDLMERIADEYNEMLANGIEEEDARFVLPNACKTHIVITMNARQWLHFFWMRCSPQSKAQWEIKELALRVLAELRSIAPILFEEVVEC